MCAQKDGKPSASGQLAIASRRRPSVRWRSSGVMAAIASLKARLKKMLVQLAAGGMSAGAESGRSARIGGARLIKPTFRPDSGRTVDGHLSVVLFQHTLPTRGTKGYDRFPKPTLSQPHHVNRDYHRTDPHQYPNPRKAHSIYDGGQRAHV